MERLILRAIGLRDVDHDGDLDQVWSLRNNNSAPMTVSWSLFGGSESGTLTLPSHQYVYFWTDAPLGLMQVYNNRSLLALKLSKFSYLNWDPFDNGTPVETLPDLFTANGESVNLGTVQQSDYRSGTNVTAALEGNDWVMLPDAATWAYVPGTLFDAGDGNDSVVGGGLADQIFGGLGDDSLRGGLGNDTLLGGAGNDTLVGGAGSDSLLGGLGNDLIDAGTGVDWIDAGDGQDTILLAGERLGYTITTSGATVILTPIGSSDGIKTLQGAEYVGFSDRVVSWAALTTPDTVPNGGGGNNDTLPGPGGNDTLPGSDDNDTLPGSDGNDTLPVTGDRILVGSDQPDQLAGGNGNDTLRGGAGADTLTGSSGNDWIDGGAGFDIAVFSGARSDYTIVSEAGGFRVTHLNGGADGSDWLVNVEALAFANEVVITDDLIDNGPADTFTGTAGNDTIIGTGGNDVLRGDRGADSLVGLAGQDTLYGGTGNDRLFGGAGADWIDGGADIDVAVFAGRRSEYLISRSGDLVTVRRLADPSDVDTLYAVEGLQFADRELNTARIRLTPRDFSGDGRADILWRNSANGNLNLWQMDGRGVTSNDRIQAGGKTVAVAAALKVQGVADFSGDGKPDILWRNSTNGNLALWEMDGNTVMSTGRLNRDGTSIALADHMKIEGIGDFNGDGKTDILLRNTLTRNLRVWTMDGRSVETNSAAQAGDVTLAPGMNMRVEGVADFTGDGKADILLRNTDNGNLRLWEMDGATVSANTRVLQGGSAVAMPLNQTVAGIADFTGDGKADILWRNTDNGALNLWEMAGSEKAFGSRLQRDGKDAMMPGNQTLAGVGDYNGDGTADLLWRNTDNGAVNIWQMDRETVTSYGRVQMASGLAVLSDQVASGVAGLTITAY